MHTILCYWMRHREKEHSCVLIVQSRSITKLSMLFYAIKIRNCQIIKSRLKAIWLICKWCYMNQTNIAFRYIRILWICDLVFQRVLLNHKMNLFYSKNFTLFLCKGHKNHLTTKNNFLEKCDANMRLLQYLSSFF